MRDRATVPTETGSNWSDTAASHVDGYLSLACVSGIWPFLGRLHSAGWIRDEAGQRCRPSFLRWSPPRRFGGSVSAGFAENRGLTGHLLFSDPSRNVPIDGQVGNSGKTKHREFAMASGEMASPERTRFLATAFRNMAEVSMGGSIPFLGLDCRHMGEMLAAWLRGGYGRSPKSTRFKPGQSGNPKGRRKGSKNRRTGPQEEQTKDIILVETYSGITVRDGDRNVTMPMVQVVIRSMAVNVAKGQHRAQCLFAQPLASVQSSRKLLHDEYLGTAMGYKVEWERELQRREALGITDLPPPLPHPDHIKIGMNTGTVQIAGPMTKEEQAELEMWKERAEELKGYFAVLREKLDPETYPEEIADIERDIRMGEDVIGTIERALALVR